MLAMLADQPDQALRIEDRGQIELGRGLLAVAHHAAQMRRVDVLGNLVPAMAAE